MASASHEITIREVEVALPEDDVLPAAFAVPASPERAPAVLVLHEALGLNDDIRRIARRFATHGYAALAPDFLAGLGPMPLCLARFMRGVNRGRTSRPYRQLDAARGWLAAQPRVDADRIGVVGFCIGGGFALLWAASADPAVRVAAPFYGPVPSDAEHRFRGICPVVAGYGGRDRPFRAMPRRLDDALDAMGVEHEVHVYPAAGHSFMNRLDGPLGWVGRHLPMHAGLHEPSAEAAWERMLAFFGNHLAPPPR